MLSKKVATAYGLFRDGGVKKVYDYSWLRLQMLARGHKNEVRIDRCTFSLEGITDGSTRIELITHNYEAPERRAIARYCTTGFAGRRIGWFDGSGLVHNQQTLAGSHGSPGR